MTRDDVNVCRLPSGVTIPSARIPWSEYQAWWVANATDKGPQFENAIWALWERANYATDAWATAIREGARTSPYTISGP